MIVYGKKVLTLIIKYHNEKISKREKSYNKKILGKTIANWTKDALLELKPKTVLLNKQNTLNSVLQKYVNDFDYIAVFYYDTPLITIKNATDSIDYAVLKELDVCNLPKGFVFKTEFIVSQQQLTENEKQNISFNKRNNQSLDNNKTTTPNLIKENYTSPSLNKGKLTEPNFGKSKGVTPKDKNINQNQKQTLEDNKPNNNPINPPPNTQSFIHYETEFLQAYDLNNFSKIENAILQRVIQHHKQNGVSFIAEQNVVIDYNCKIGGGTVVYPNNYILNGSVIEKNCTLMPGNIIDNSTLHSGIALTYCVATNSSIEKNLTPFSVIENNVLVKWKNKYKFSKRE